MLSYKGPDVDMHKGARHARHQPRPAEHRPAFDECDLRPAGRRRRLRPAEPGHRLRVGRLDHHLRHLNRGRRRLQLGLVL
jgi:hypothetical protein